MKRNPAWMSTCWWKTQILLRMIDGDGLRRGGALPQERVRLHHLVRATLCLRVRGPLAQAPGPQRPVRENLILRNQGSGSGSRDVGCISGCWRRNHVGDFRHIVEISDLFVIKELVKADCGITFLYRKAVEKELAEGALGSRLTDFVSQRSTFLVEEQRL